MVDDYTEVRECDYKDEHYSVRDNGAVMRHLREGKRVRKDDGIWTFGNKNAQGYMMIGTHRVHIIVAFAFYGPQDSKEYVVDHKDTNRCNNRIDNLQWVTNLENVLNNPITRKKIILRCGSIEAFLQNPKLLQEGDVPQDISWMRTVTEAEAKVSKERLQAWAESDKVPIGNSLGEWIFDQTSSNLIEVPYIMSLTPRAGQIKFFYDDKPIEYPATPQDECDNPLQVYAEALKENMVFSRSHGGKREYLVHKFDMSSDGQSLVVMTKTGYVWRSAGDNDSYEVRITELNNNEYSEDDLSFAINKVCFRDNLYIHERISDGFMPKEYLDEQYQRMIEKNNLSCDEYL